MMSKIRENISLKFYSKKLLEVKFSGLDLSSDGGLLLIKQAERNIKICEGLANCLVDERELGKVRHPIKKLINQRVFQMVAGYEDAIDSNYLRHDPIFKIACDNLPIINEELLASQPTISRLENSISKQEIKRLRSFFLVY